MPRACILVPGYGAQGGKGADLVHFFDKDGLGAIVNSSRGIIYAGHDENFAQASAEKAKDLQQQMEVELSKIG